MIYFQKYANKAIHYANNAYNKHIHNDEGLKMNNAKFIDVYKMENRNACLPSVWVMQFEIINPLSPYFGMGDETIIGSVDEIKTKKQAIEVAKDHFE